MNTESPRAPRLTVSGVHHRYGNSHVLRDISLNVAPGEIVCLVGPSGCGKSTLLRLIAGLELLQAGEIRMDADCVASAQRHVQPEKRNTGLVFQDFALFPHMSLQDNVAFGLAHKPRAQREVITRTMLARVGLADRASDAPHTLSGGQQQRVALARALAPGPGLVLLDEPFSNLDVRLRHRLRTDTLALLRERNAASILVTHDPEEAMFMADRIALMHEGRIVQIGSPAELYYQPVSPFAAEFFGDVNRIQTHIIDGHAVTPVGRFPSSGLAEGSRAAVLIRPEAITLGAHAEAGSIAAEIIDSHMLGATTLVSLQVSDSSGGDMTLQSQLTSGIACMAGDTVWLRIDSAGAFVFAD
ncbi:ABC transporter ATP-binding protein [Uliginosibacterium sp. H3]|uniref:ABC transporter ATP-binding protein n=1 Tax=Uliginosibacterium silvisoli TaxID=3114758 RepID=A0ABU6K3V0_9RHOO|nr:ABC transporter ATP-binding protein [Uliginosibacterium sp. H3]